MNVIVQVRPEGVGPSWWAHTTHEEYSDNIVTWTWATIMAIRDPDDEIEEPWTIGGWTLGADPSHAVPLEAAQAIADLWYEEHGDGPWQFQLLATD